MKTQMRILAVVAHCRDAFDMIGGTLANHIERGDAVTVAVISAENYSDAWRLADQVRTTKKRALTTKRISEESRLHRQRMTEACEILGVTDIRFVPQRGVLIKSDPELPVGIAALIQNVRPQLMITHHPNENAGIGDHPACGRAAMDAMWLASMLRPGQLPPFKVAQVFFMCLPGETTRLDAESVNRYPAIQIDVTRQIERKLRALSLLATQYATPARAAKELEMLSGQAALHSRISYMEAFQTYRPEIYEYLPVSERTLALAELPMKSLLDQVKLITPYLPGVRAAATPAKTK